MVSREADTTPWRFGGRHFACHFPIRQSRDFCPMKSRINAADCWYSVPVRPTINQMLCPQNIGRAAKFEDMA